MKRTKNKLGDYITQFGNWKFTITELVGGDTDYVFRTYIDNENIFIYGGWSMELPDDYKTLNSAKKAVENFISKELTFRN